MKHIFALIVLSSLFLVGCGPNKVLVKKDSCVEVFDGALLECEKAVK